MKYKNSVFGRNFTTKIKTMINNNDPNHWD